MAARPRDDLERRRKRGILAVAAVLAFGVLAPDVSFAAPRICRQLEAELASAGRASPARSGKTEAAIARQREQLGLAKNQARRAGCRFRLFKSGSGTCTALDQKIDKMERNLASLERRGGGSSRKKRSRSQIEAALRANGCGDEEATRKGPRNLIEHIFGGGMRKRGPVDEVETRDGTRQARAPREPQGQWVNEGGRIRFSAPPGRYRTLCVRTCDGYYFPVSNAASPSDFERDQANCRSSCSGTEVELYYTKPRQESESMVSGVSGRPYSELPTAWLYKQPGIATPEGCSCNAPRKNETAGFSVVAGDPSAEETITAAVPDASLDTDPSRGAETERETAVAPESGPAIGTETAVTSSQAGRERTSSGERKRIRVVGPVFLPDPEVAEGLQAQGRIEVW